jgi:hypothetical protein
MDILRLKNPAWLDLLIAVLLILIGLAILGVATGDYASIAMAPVLVLLAPLGVFKLATSGNIPEALIGIALLALMIWAETRKWRAIIRIPLLAVCGACLIYIAAWAGTYVA